MFATVCSGILSSPYEILKVKSSKVTKLSNSLKRKYRSLLRRSDSWSFNFTFYIVSFTKCDWFRLHVSFIDLIVFVSSSFIHLLSNLCAKIFSLASEEHEEGLSADFFLWNYERLEILLNMPSFLHICCKLLFLQFPFPTVICGISIVKTPLSSKCFPRKGFCCHRPFSTSMDLIFPFF